MATKDKKQTLEYKATPPVSAIFAKRVDPPKTKEEARAQIRSLIGENKPALDALSKL